MTQEELDKLEAELFASARGEQASDAIRERTLSLMLEKRGRSRRTSPLVVTAAVLAAAAGVALLVSARSPDPGISAEHLEPELATSLAHRPRNEPAPPAAMPGVSKPAQPSPNGPVRPEKPGKPASSTAAPLSLEEEARALQDVRAALRGGRAKEAIAALDRYESTASSRSMGAEARLLRIQALAATGRTGEASKLAERFLVAYPNSPLVDRAKRYLLSSGVGGNEMTGDVGR